MLNSDENNVVVCPNCTHPYQGNFCSSCGQKNVTDKHSKSFRHLFNEFLHGFLHYDGKIIQAIKYLILKPGFLSEQYFKNRHQSFIKPFTLLLLFTLFLYFFGLKLHIVHQFSIATFLKQSSPLGTMLSTYVHKNGLDTQTFIHEFDAYKTSWQKFYYTLLVPFAGLVCSLLLFPKKRFFVEHLVFSIHMVCAYILLLFIYIILLIPAQLIFDFRGDSQIGLLVAMAAYLVYSVIAVRKAYALHWAYATFTGTILSLFILWMDLGMHNMLVSYLTFFFNYII